jgi:membrane fusion protein (multidrug efflux system)
MMKLFYLAFIILTGLLSCTSSASKNNSKEIVPEILVTKVTTRDTIVKTAYVASFQAIQNTEIRSRVNGFLENILIDEGKPVVKGQALFQLSTEELVIDESKAIANLDMAIAEAKAAALEVERVDVLVDKKVITITELDLAKAKLKAAEAKISEANAMLAETKLKRSYATIRAPFDGVVNRLLLKTGSLIEEGTMLTSVTDIRSVFAYFSVSENEYLRFNKVKAAKDNQFDSVSLILSDGSNYRYAGAIETMYAEIDPSTGSLVFRARFPNPKALLKHGATGKVVLTTNVTNVVIIPQKAVFEIQDRNFVFLVDKNNVIHQQAFEPISRLGQYYLVKSGLQQGDRIVYEGTQNLREGNKINPKQVSAEGLKRN